uniref:F-box domain-containing protein n=1 Tax=Leucosporidium scottii TaxID=5278 RepID=A0A0H5FSS3_9BASI|nr:hypothetical protein [Leucosporidium scottii]
MAVIQDLPLELLRRILELLATDRPSQKNLYNATLVARAWRHPSQSLLLYHMHFRTWNLTLCTDALRLNAGCTLRLVDVDWLNARDFLGALQEHDISVETLPVYNTQDSDPDIRLPTIPPDTKLELTHLYFNALSLPSLAFFDSILPAAPFLTYLELEVRDDGELFPTEYMSPFQSIAHQLRHLTISSYSCSPTSQASLSVTRFVAACTSPRSLELCDCSTAYIKDVVTASSGPLALLETELAAGWNDGGTGVAELAAVLELPAVAKLKRWRLSNYTGGGPLLNKEARARWEAVCRARGVEPRDDRCFFTDGDLLTRDQMTRDRRTGCSSESELGIHFRGGKFGDDYY